MSTTTPQTLRELAKDRWQTRGQWLLRRSVVLGYAAGYSEVKYSRRRKVSPLLQYVVEHCSAFLRLMTLSAAAYERAIEIEDFENHEFYAWLSLTCAYSSMDAMAAAIAGIVLGKPFYGDEVPGVGRMKSLLTKHLQSNPKLAAMIAHFDQLRATAPWYLALHSARNNVVHRGFWPSSPFRNEGWSLHQGPVWWQVYARSGFASGEGTPTNSVPLDLEGIVYGFIYGLESWEKSMAKDLRQCEKLEPPKRRPIIHCISLKWGGIHFPESRFIVNG